MKTKSYTLKTWIVRNPITAVIFAWNFGAIATLAGSRHDLLPILASLFCIVVLSWVAHVWLDAKKWTALLVVLALAAAPVQANPEPEPEPLHAAGIGGIILGATVIVIGGVVYYCLRRMCQKFFPPPPEKPPAHEDEDDGEASADPPIALTYADPTLDYCIEAASLVAPTGVTITVIADVVPRIESIRLASIVVREQYEQALLPYGISLTNSCAIGGVPQQSVPITVDFNGVTVGTGGVTLTLETSTDLAYWEPLITTTVPVGSTNVFADVVSGPIGFYRVRVNQ